MDLLVLKMEERKEMGSRASQKLRASGRVPAILYGLGRETVTTSFKTDAIEKVVHQSTHLVELASGDVQQQALLTDVQFDALGDKILHVDFRRVARDKKVTVSVPLEFEGHAKGVAAGGVLEHLMNDIEVECLPRHIPAHVLVEVSGIGIGEHLFARDLVLPDGVTIVDNPDAVVVTVSYKGTTAEEAEEAEEPVEPEIIGHKKDEKDEEGEPAK